MSRRSFADCSAKKQLFFFPVNFQFSNLWNTPLAKTISAEWDVFWLSPLFYEMIIGLKEQDAAVNRSEGKQWAGCIGHDCEAFADHFAVVFGRSPVSRPAYPTPYCSKSFDIYSLDITLWGELLPVRQSLCAWAKHRCGGPCQYKVHKTFQVVINMRMFVDVYNLYVISFKYNLLNVITGNRLNVIVETLQDAVTLTLTLTLSIISTHCTLL